MKLLIPKVFWTLQTKEAAEFLSFFLCIIFLVFCLTYYKEYEQKADAQRKEQIIRITVDEQKKELETVKRSEQAIKIMRHDMRHFLANLSACIDNDDKITAKKIVIEHFAVFIRLISWFATPVLTENSTVYVWHSTNLTKSVRENLIHYPAFKPFGGLIIF